MLRARLACLVTVLLLFVVGCAEKPDLSLPDDELGIFLNASHDKSFEEACAEIETLCASTGAGCFAYDFFCDPSTQEEWVCLRLYYACRDGAKQNACNAYSDRCTFPDEDTGVPVEPEPDAGTPTPEPDAGTPTPEPDSGVPTPDPDSGVPTPDPDSGVPTPDPDSGVPTPDPDVGVPTPPDSGAPSGTIWQPLPGTTWQWQLTGRVDTSVNAKMFDIDLFDNSTQTIAQLKSMGRVVICYFSAGSYEDWRPDASDIPDEARGSKMSGWDELWIDIRHPAVRDVMKARLDLAKSKGCDGVEPDNVDGYSNNNGLGLTASDQLDYNKFLAAEAHKRGLSIALKNDLDQVRALEPFFDFAVNEECLQWNECDMLAPFISAGKAVFHTEYEGSTSSVCSQTASLQFSTIIKRLDLDAWVQPCW